jgi:hypothetical protein
MKNVKEDKIIVLFAIVGMFSVLIGMIAFTYHHIHPFFAYDNNGNATIIGRILLTGIYIVEFLALVLAVYITLNSYVKFLAPRKKAN